MLATELAKADLSFPLSVLPMPGTKTADKPAFGQTSPKRKVALGIAWLNKSDVLKSALFDENHPDNLYLERLKSGSILSVMRPTAGYTPGTVLVTTAGPDTFKHSNPYQTETIYDYPLDAQEAYWLYILFSMEYLEVTGGASTNVVAVENCMANVSNFDHRTARTIRTPHMHILRLKAAYLRAHQGEVLPHITEEQWLVQSTMEGFLKQLLANHPELQRYFVNDASIKNAPPYGYTFTVNKADLAAAMNAHHQASKQTATEYYKHLKGVIPHPSYRVYVTTQGNQATVTISQAFRFTGVMEFMNIMLDRDANNPRLMSVNHEKNLHSGLQKYFQLQQSTHPAFAKNSSEKQSTS